MLTDAELTREFLASLFEEDPGPSFEEISRKAYADTMRWARDRERRGIWRIWNAGPPGRRARLPLAWPRRVSRLRQGGHYGA